MATFLALTNSVLARLNEVQLTSSTFSNARGIQVQAQNAVNEAVRYINQREFNYPFNHCSKTETLVPGSVRYSITTDAKHVDYNTARIVTEWLVWYYDVNNRRCLPNPTVAIDETTNLLDILVSTSPVLVSVCFHNIP